MSSTSYYEKMKQANKEAKATIIGLAVTILVWTMLGFGLSHFDVSIFHTPLWVIGGTIGVWVCAVVVAIVLGRYVMVDIDLEEDLDGKEACDE